MIQHIFSIGFGSAVLDLDMVILTVMMNKQIMKYGSTAELAVFGVIVTALSLFNAMFCGVGQAIQPLVSANHGAENAERIKSFWKLSLGTVLTFGVIFTAICELFPVPMVKLFVDATPEMINAAPTIVRLFSVLYIPLGITVLSIYYLQSIMRDKTSIMIAILRSVVVSVLIYILPLFFKTAGVWIAMPASETVVAAIAMCYIYQRKKL